MNDNENQAPDTDLQPTGEAPETEQTVTVGDHSAGASTGKTSKRKKVLLLCVALVLIAGGAVAARLLTANSNPSSQASTSTDVATTQAGRVFCVSLGLKSLQCEDLQTTELRKYVMPKAVATTLYQNKTGSKFLLDDSGYRENDKSFHETWKVYDAKLQFVVALPDSKTSDGMSTLANVQWLNDDTLIYQKQSTSTGTPTSTSIYAFDTTAKTERLLVKANANIEYFISTGNDGYLYAVVATDDASTNSVSRKLAVLNVKDGTIKDIANAAAEPSNYAYDAITGQFYQDVLRQAEQKFDIHVYAVDNLTSAPQLRQLAVLPNVHTLGTQGYQTVTTIKGVATAGDGTSLTYPIKFYDNSGKATTAQLASGSMGASTVLALPSFPSFPAAASAKAVVSDFFAPAKDTPKRITTFLSDQVANNPDCHQGEYLSLVVDKYDQDDQFSVQEAGCGHDYLAFYKWTGTTYKRVTATQEGLSCTARDSMGISAVVFPNCRKHGEDL